MFYQNSYQSQTAHEYLRFFLGKENLCIYFFKESVIFLEGKSFYFLERKLDFWKDNLKMSSRFANATHIFTPVRLILLLFVDQGLGI